ncbi:MAG: hypothetical protein KAQ99_01175 [Candidatus Aureabacteria bacterium]|nr:hypothetical protein [Candidatus Auribacterota bacterium]
MKKIIFCVCILVVFLQLDAHSLDTGLLDIRNQIFDESKAIKPLIAASTDSVLLSSMWDSCLISIAHIDAYFFMLAIFNAIKDEDLTEETVGYLTAWLKRVKKTNNINIEGFQNIAEITDDRIKTHIRVLKNYFDKLDNLLNAEIDKVDTIRRSVGK